ncbi:phosphatase PAP2 family protein [Pedobacter sp. Hv1]|uniref:phosphatase PAP2 family protein n=1 Tax=Pedobacter sp. Hv1 TaxID=1740090 RepID=UPI0006D89805|nr:phosphatase PAP2 family protein [Pedobacter sp. Hv1]KQC00223.1 hypothetical protein AQF98_12020 [Pedobacter sp. Hv1]
MKNVFLLLFLLSATFAHGQDSVSYKKDSFFKTSGKVLKNSMFAVPRDFAFMGKEVGQDWAKTGWYTAGILNLILTDKITTKFLHEHIEPNVNYSLPNISLVKNTDWLSGNDAYMSYPIIGLYLGSLITNNEKGQYVALNAFKAVTHSIIISQLTLKTIFGRNRPNRPLNTTAQNVKPWTTDNFDFFNKRDAYLFSDIEGSSFPSLHATAYFAIAKVFQMEYDNYWIPYGLMSIVFLADVKGHNHWVSDMAVGGIIGTIIGRSIVKSSWKIRYGTPERKKKNYSINFMPQFSPGMGNAPGGLYFSLRLNRINN